MAVTLEPSRSSFTCGASDNLSLFQDLCERQEKNVVNDHQKALQKMQSYKRKKMSATLQGNDGVSPLNHTKLGYPNQQ